MINSSLSAIYGAMTGLRKEISQNIISSFQTFIPLEDRNQNQDTFTRSSPE